MYLFKSQKRTERVEDEGGNARAERGACSRANRLHVRTLEVLGPLVFNNEIDDALCTTYNEPFVMLEERN